MELAEIGIILTLFITVCDQIKRMEENDESAQALIIRIQSIERRVSYIPPAINLPNMVLEQLAKLRETLLVCEAWLNAYAQRRENLGRTNYDTVRRILKTFFIANSDEKRLNQIMLDLERCCQELDTVVTWVSFLDNRERDYIATQRYQEILSAIQQLHTRESFPLSRSASLSEYFDFVLQGLRSLPSYLVSGIHGYAGCRPFKDRFESIKHELSMIEERDIQYHTLKNTLISLYFLLSSARHAPFLNRDDFQYQFTNAISLLEMILNLHGSFDRSLVTSTYDRAIMAIKNDDIKTGYALLRIAVKDSFLRADAAYQLGKFYLYGSRKKGNPVSKDIAEGQNWFKMAAFLGHFKACYQAAINYAYDDPETGFKHNLSKAKKAAKQAVKLAKNADEAEKGQHLISLIQRKRYVTKANQGDTNSMFKAAMMFFNMQGVPNGSTRESCKQEAIRFASRAAANDHEDAKTFLRNFSTS